MLKKLIYWLVSKTTPYKELEKALDAAISNNIDVRKIDLNSDELNVSITTNIANFIAAMFIKHMDILCAENYIEYQFSEKLSRAYEENREPRHVIVTAQRKKGKSPHEVSVALEQEVLELKAKLAKYESVSN
jgi:hypothetical protein